MNRIILFLAAIATLSIVAAPIFPAAAALKPKPKPMPQHAAVAPADEYFGRMKMSVLEITNQIRDADIRMGFNPELAANQFGKLSFTQNALEDWAGKYPRDSWIAERAYNLSHLFWRMHTPEGDTAAGRCRDLMLRLFPASRFASQARTETAAGVAPPAPVVAPTLVPVAAGGTH